MLQRTACSQFKKRDEGCDAIIAPWQLQRKGVSPLWADKNTIGNDKSVLTRVRRMPRKMVGARFSIACRNQWAGCHPDENVWPSNGEGTTPVVGKVVLFGKGAQGGFLLPPLSEASVHEPMDPPLPQQLRGTSRHKASVPRSKFQEQETALHHRVCEWRDENSRSPPTRMYLVLSTHLTARQGTFAVKPPHHEADLVADDSAVFDGETAC